ncbi:hypothetical protein AB0J52_31545, partial [Spirillospora sp. NPDC049652]
MNVTLDELRQQVARLLDGSSRQPASVRVQAGELVVEMHWPEAAAPGGAAPVEAAPPPPAVQVDAHVVTA